MTQQPTHHALAESISALMDNEASELELQRILKASESDLEVKATWSRYQVASAVMRSDLPALELGDFSARMTAALEAEENHSLATSAANTPATGKKSSVWQNISRFAVAASVAGGVVFFAQNYNGSVADAPVVATAESALESQPSAVLPAASLPAGYHSQPLTARTVGLQNSYEPRQSDSRQVIFVPRQTSQVGARASNEEVRNYLNQLIKEHADNAALNSGQGMLPFARVVLTEED